MKRENLYKIALGLAFAPLLLTGCSDEWDDHYDGTAKGVLSGTLWDAIRQDANLSNFASVVSACGYDKALGSSQVFTVFAPGNDVFSSEQAQALINSYNSQKGSVSDDENSTVKEFLQNHIALYNYSVSSKSNDSIVMMNGKYSVLTPNGINGTAFTESNQHFQNGVLFKVGSPLKFFPNVFEYIRQGSELDSLYNFFYSNRFYRRVFQPDQSVAGGIVDGKTVYLDSVFKQENELFGRDFLDAQLNREDSTYWMIAPTNRVWRELVEEYTPYFNYDKTVADSDSIVYTNTRLAIVKGTVFSRGINFDNMVRDSLMSTNATYYYSSRKKSWGNDTLHYYQYMQPYAPGGVLTDTQVVPCSNGVMYVSDNWKINKLETFFQTRIIEAEAEGSIKEVSKQANQQGVLEEMANPRYRTVDSKNAFYGQVSGNAFVEFEPTTTTVQPGVTFNIKNVLSNIGYDIYLVTAPALANDSNATAIQSLPTILNVYLGYHNKEGVKQEKELARQIETKGDVVNYMLLAEDFKFPVASYGLNEDEPQVTLRLETNVRPRAVNVTHTRVMRIDCIILKPHEGEIK
ncbi:MAG: fasciclin domain-containing protein [Prevotella sp.]|nr:fasciclin domain-containing protein [Prevotella sp.]